MEVMFCTWSYNCTLTCSHGYTTHMFTSHLTCTSPSHVHLFSYHTLTCSHTTPSHAHIPHPHMLTCPTLLTHTCVPRTCTGSSAPTLSETTRPLDIRWSRCWFGWPAPSWWLPLLPSSVKGGCGLVKWDDDCGMVLWWRCGLEVGWWWDCWRCGLVNDVHAFMKMCQWNVFITPVVSVV